MVQGKPSVVNVHGDNGTQGNRDSDPNTQGYRKGTLLLLPLNLDHSYSNHEEGTNNPETSSRLIDLPDLPPVTLPGLDPR